MQKQVFPIIGDEKDLPFYIVGIGVECWQYPVDRTGGYDYPQILVTNEGEGEITVNGESVKLPENSVFYIPPHLPHKYHSLSKAWIVSWVCFSGSGAEPLLEKWGLDHYDYFPAADAERMNRILRKAYYAIKSDKIYGNHYASANLYDLLIEYRKIWAVMCGASISC